MAARKIIIICEDILHHTFLRAFLYRRGFTRKEVPPPPTNDGKGDAKSRACERFCKELIVLRRFARPGHAIIFALDADNLTIDERMRTMVEACKSHGIEPPSRNDAVFGIIPKWEIEYWLAYLRGEEVDEHGEKVPYDKYKGCESKIYPLVERLADTCQQQKELKGAPPSLIEACKVYDKFMQWKKNT